MKIRKTLLSTLMALALASPVFGQAAPAAAPPAPVASGTWALDQAHTNIGFAVRHMMVSNVRGSFGTFSGEVRYDGKNVSSIAADITIDTASITTNNAKRDAHLKSADFFDVGAFPTITFKSKAVQAAGPDRFTLVGDLTMHGVTREVTLDIEGPSQPVVVQGATRMGATATTTVNRQDFGVKWSRSIDGGGVVVGDDVKITLELELVKRAPVTATEP